MGFPGLGRRPLAFMVMGAVVIVVAFPFFVECRLTGEVHGKSPNPQQPTEEGSTPTDVGVCPTSGGSPQGSLVLTAKKDPFLKFQCGTGSALSPQKSADFLNVYQYTETQSAKSCNSAKEISLDTALTGAKLTEQNSEASSGGRKSPFYVFQYSDEPDHDTLLCYTCNRTTRSDDSSQDLSGPVTMTNDVLCTVYIKVPKRQEEQPPTEPPTTPPGSTSGARAAPAAVVAAVGGLLVVMLCI